MKTLYPAPAPKHTTLDIVHNLQSRLAHRTRGSFRASRVVRCSTKLWAMRVLNQLERSLS